MSHQELVDRWLAERRHLLVELVGISRGVRSRTASAESLNVRVQMFCDRLVDYVSAGHFEVYADLTATPDGARLLSRLWQQLKTTTDKVLAFNERVSRKQMDRQQLGMALAETSLALEDRFTIEDRLVAAAKSASTAAARPALMAGIAPMATSPVRGARASMRSGTHQRSHAADPVGMNATTVRRSARAGAVSAPA